MANPENKHKICRKPYKKTGSPGEGREPDCKYFLSGYTTYPEISIVQLNGCAGMRVFVPKGMSRPNNCLRISREDYFPFLSA